MPDEIRRRQVLEAIASGRLPSRLPTTSWAGYGSGAVCAVCRKLIDADQLETEFKDRGGSAERTISISSASRRGSRSAQRARTRPSPPCSWLRTAATVPPMSSTPKKEPSDDAARVLGALLLDCR